jgi:predicted RNase H-like nuclease (RuvC/YqgF family)
MRFIHAALAISFIGFTTAAVIEHRGKIELSKQLTLSQQREAAMESALQTEAKRSSRLQELLAEKSRELHELVARLDSANQQLTSLKEDVQSRDQHISQLQTDLLVSQQSVSETNTMNFSKASPSVELDPVAVSFSLPRKQGRVVQVNPDWDFVVVNLGWDSVKLGDIVEITRENKVIAQAAVERIQQAAAAARVLPAYPAGSIQLNDLVMAKGAKN